MPENETYAEHIQRVLARCVVPEFPSGMGLVLVAVDVKAGGFGWATTLTPETAMDAMHMALEADAADDEAAHEDYGEEAPATYMRVGDMVEACADCGHSLRSGARVFDRAVVICTDPLMLVSECATMLWTKPVLDLHLHFVGEADPWLLKKCLTLLPEKTA